MRTISLLDCTLRDGGYLNDWNFGHQHLMSIYGRLVDSGVDIVEIGFLDERRPFDVNRSIMPDEECAGRIWGGVKRKAPMTVGMIDYGTCGLSHLRPQKESFLDGIRVIFKKERSAEAMDFCAGVKELGYKVFSQLVSVTAYEDEELRAIAERANQVKPYALSMVDTYGLLDPEQLIHIFSILDETLDPSIRIGFHAHNNMQLAFANSLAFLKHETQRSLIVDGTIFGMGKSAGNAPLELLMDHMNACCGKNYELAAVLEALEESILEFRTRFVWGYQLPFFLSARNRCHPAYVNLYRNKEELSVAGLDRMLSGIEPAEKKLLYDKELAEEHYKEYLTGEGDDEKAYAGLKKRFENKALLLVGPGKNIRLQKDAVKEYVEKKKPLVISVNYLPEDLHCDYVLATKTNRYQQMLEKLQTMGEECCCVIATENVECLHGHEVIRLQREPLLEREERFCDNSFLMLLRILKRIGVTEAACAGFDGYSRVEENYFNPQMEYVFVREEAERMNRHMREAITGEFASIRLDFITYSRYTEVEDTDRAGF
ncbi:MAG: aldolase catalytic domain-containing protein [Lachnospiraceae bacterium]|nr:aldolase catalytic domain-containing protein [Lachnospiraceae bacterium]